LARSVIGDVAAAASFVKRDTFLPQQIFACQQMLALAVAPLRDDVGMFAEQQHIIDGAGLARGHDAFLQSIRFGVVDETEIGDKAVTGDR